ncbi:MAG: prepilin-type N-terminal cleavage/methylation domain-containing protein [Firmicutes bacterium]|nr:prepilin-type N-terminal cleavage/methylation domain-containing protein [Bacillota bacterium]
MNYKLVRKLKNDNKGFSIAEMLIAVLIVLMVSGVIAAGMPVAANAYRKVTDSANAQLLLSTTVSELREELGEASDVTHTASTRVINYTSTVGGASKIEFKDDGVYITAENVNSGSERLLVSGKASAGMVFKVTKVEYSSGVLTLTGVKVTRIGKDDELASLKDGLTIRVIGGK